MTQFRRKSAMPRRSGRVGRRPRPRPSAARLVVALVTTAITLARAFTRRTVIAARA